MFNNSQVNSQYMQDEANFIIARGNQAVHLENVADIGKAVDTDSVKEAVEDTKKSVDKQVETSEDVANEMAKARAKDNELQVKPVSYQQMPNAPVNYNLQSKMVSGMGNYKFIQSLFGNSFVQALGSLFAVKTLFTGDTKEKLLSMLFLELQLIYTQLINMGNTLVEIATIGLMSLMMGRQNQQARVQQLGNVAQNTANKLDEVISDNGLTGDKIIQAADAEVAREGSKLTKIGENTDKMSTNVKAIKTSVDTSNKSGSSGVASGGGTGITGGGIARKGGASGISAKNGNFGFVQNLFGNSFMQLAGTAFSLKTLFSGDDKEKLLSMIYIELQLIYSAINNIAVFSGFAKGGIVHAAKGYTFQNRANGLVSGPGTSTSDSIPAMLSNGEAVLNAKAVRQLGINFINAVNNGNFSRIRTRHLASGGVLGNAQQSTARGMTDFARNIGTNVSTTNNMSVALVRDENEAMKHFMRSPEGQKILVDFQRGNGRVFTRF
jgi:hypothetical protein